jgi:hypothetical protein
MVTFVTDRWQTFEQTLWKDAYLAALRGGCGTLNFAIAAADKAVEEFRKRSSERN